MPDHSQDSNRAKLLDLHLELTTNELVRHAKLATDPAAKGILRSTAEKLRAVADQIEARLDAEPTAPHIETWGDPEGGDSGIDYQDFPCS